MHQLDRRCQVDQLPPMPAIVAAAPGEQDERRPQPLAAGGNEIGGHPSHRILQVLHEPVRDLLQIPGQGTQNAGERRRGGLAHQAGFSAR